jgi:hypothetical protein
VNITAFASNSLQIKLYFILKKLRGYYIVCTHELKKSVPYKTIKLDFILAERHMFNLTHNIEVWTQINVSYSEDFSALLVE